MKPITRAKTAAKLLKQKAADINFYLGRQFDDCFENGDGDLVIEELAKLMLSDNDFMMACQKLRHNSSVNGLIKQLEDHNEEHLYCGNCGTSTSQCDSSLCPDCGYIGAKHTYAQTIGIVPYYSTYTQQPQLGVTA